MMLRWIASTVGKMVLCAIVFIFAVLLGCLIIGDLKHPPKPVAGAEINPRQYTFDNAKYYEVSVKDLTWEKTMSGRTEVLLTHMDIDDPGAFGTIFIKNKHVTIKKIIIVVEEQK